jgi:nitroimidazol reductase NimA-like FMN-containing flavoprotein (pyridoxamine 5'-phosphate oxidase superfamily)
MPRWAEAADGASEPEVCFQVDHRSSRSDWQSVIACGALEELRRDNATRAMDLLFDRLLPLLASEGAATIRDRASESLAAGAPVDRIAIYRIRLRVCTDRFERPV